MLGCSAVSDSATAWALAHQAPLFPGFPRKEDWGRLPCPPSGGLPDPGIEPTSPALAGRFFMAEPLEKLLVVTLGGDD